MSYSFFPPGERSRRVCEGAAVLEEGLGGAVEAAQLVVKLLHYFGLLLEPAIINVLHNFAAFLKSEIDVETIHEQSNFHFQEIKMGYYSHGFEFKKVVLMIYTDSTRKLQSF